MIGAANGIDVDQAAGLEGGIIDVVDNGDSDWNDWSSLKTVESRASSVFGRGIRRFGVLGRCDAGAMEDKISFLRN